MITPFEEKKFQIPELQGISAKSIEEHLGLYAGYVKNYNAINAQSQRLMSDENALALAELQRRLSFEFGGMRLHEYYFAHFEGGSQAADPAGSFAKAVETQFGSIEGLKKLLKSIAGMRGPGWAILYYDPVSKQFVTGFTEEQHLGTFPALPIIIALDVWEHTYILDYGAAGKAKYIDAFFENLNWQSVEANFANATR